MTTTALPSELGPMGTPEGMGTNGDDSSTPFKMRTLSHEDNINRQLDRIAYLRSVGAPWAEAVYQLRDMVVGLEDEEFWDGIPQAVRTSLHDDPDVYERVAAEYAHDGWKGYPCRAIQGVDGRPIYRPTAENLSTALRIIMKLLARRGILWKRKRQTRFAPYGELLEDA